MSDEPFADSTLTKRHFLRSPSFFGGLITLIVAIAVTAFLLTGGSKAAKKKLERPVMPVEVIVAQPVDEVDYTRIFVGEIKAKRSSDLAFERSAKIKEILVDTGDAVKNGDALAHLDTEDLDIASRRAHAAFQNAQAVLDELTQGPRKETKAAAQAEVEANLAELKLAKSIWEKRQTLYQNGAISDEELEQSNSRYEAAKARHKSSVEKLNELINGTRAERKTAQAELVKQLKAEVDDVELQKRKSVLRAPYSGSISMRYLDEGTIVSPGSPVLRITEDQVLEAVVGLPPKAVKRIKVGSELACHDETNSPSSKQPKATVIRILPETDQKTRMIPVVVKLSNDDFKPGELVRIKLSEPRKQSGVFVPTVALIPSTKGLAAVYVVKGEPGNQKAVLTPVSKKYEDRQFTQGRFTLIEGTLSPGDLIISSGVQRITNGQRVTIIDSTSNNK